MKRSNNQIVRRVNGFVKPYSFYQVKFPLLVVERYKVTYHCLDCGVEMEVTELAFREGRFLMKVVGRRGWLELSLRCRIVDTRGEILLEVS